VVVLGEDLAGYGFTNFVQLLRVDPEIMNPDYVGWCLYHLHASGLVERLQHQTTQMRNLDFRDYLRILLPRPPLHEQNAIADVVQEVADALRTKKSAVARAQQMRTALLNELFSRGLPQRHTRFKKTKIGEMPAEWEVPSVNQLGDIEAGVALNQDRAPRSNIHQYLTVVNVQRGCITIDEPRYLELNESEVPKKLLQDGDIVVVEGHANSGEIGRAAMVSSAQAGLSYQNHLFRIRPTSKKVIGKFLLYALNADYARRHWNAVCNTSSGLNTINRRQLRRLLVPLPKRDEQESILGLIEAAESSIEAMEREKCALEGLRRSLRQNLLTGRVRLRVEEQAESAGDRLLAEAVG
jgi:type I restriction enzyme S subunit